MAPAARTAAARRRIGKYTVTGRIGRGGMGMVYRAYDEALEREVALKTLTVEGALDEESRRRFHIEARAAARLQHPNIVTVFEQGQDDGLPFIAMELLPGIDLEALMRSGDELLLREKLDIMVQVCRGLHFAHEHGVVHRDVKPSNIRLLEDGTVKIMDFGIAKLGGTGVTRTGMMVGTVHYMSPEQIHGQPLDGRSDLFSVGVILYELLTGRRPFAGEAPAVVLYKIVSEEAPPLATDLGDATALEGIVNRTLSKEPALRPASGGHLAQELSAVLSLLSAGALAASADVLASVAQSQRLLREGRVEESVRRLRDIAQTNPHSLEARRALRLATREMARHQTEAPAEPDDFPELAATHRSPFTQRSSEGIAEAQPTVVHDEAHGAAAGTTGTGAAEAAPLAASRRGAGRGLLAAVAFGLLAVAATGAFLVARSGEGKSAGVRGGARGAPVGSVSVVRGGAGRAAPEPPRADPAPTDVEATTLPVDEPQGEVRVSASYPVEVSWKGRSLGRGTAVTARVPVGRQVLSVEAPAQFVRLQVPVDVRTGATETVSAPALGRIHIRANPDNCRVLIDGTFVDYPPILDRPIGPGLHKVMFRWPDGKNTEVTVDVTREAPTYVMGRKE